MFFNITRYERGSQFSYVFEKDDPKLPRKRNVSSHYEEEEAHVEFVSKVEEYDHHFFIKQLKQLSTVFVIDINRDPIETLQTTEILLLKALREEDFGHELQQMSSFFSSDLHKVKLGTQLKSLAQIVDEKQVKIKDAITII